jgi:hypothetical protein
VNAVRFSTGADPTLPSRCRSATIANVAVPAIGDGASGYDPAVGKYLAIYNGAASEHEKQELTPEQQSAFMAAWAQWAQTNADALVDSGSPLFRKRAVTSEGAAEFEDAKTGYAIVEADTHDDAVRIFSTHPHLSLHSGNSIEVIECPSIPS